MVSDDARPILVQFENGVLKPQKRSTTKFKALRSKVPKSTKRMLYADTGALTYTGTIVQKQVVTLKYYLGVVDRETNVIEDTEMCQICTLKPNIQEQIATNEDSKDVKTFRQKSDTLVEAFGSAKQKRLLSSRKKNEGVHEIAADKVAEIANKLISQSPKSELSASQEAGDRKEDIIPPQNENAKRVQDIYHVDDIISFQEYQLIKKQAQDFIALDNKTLLTWKNEKKYPEYILHHLSQLPISSSEREEKACYICYMLYMIWIFKLTYKEVQKRDPCPDIPNPLKNILLDRFTHSENGKHRCVPKKYKDKALCHILVLALVTEEYEMNCNLLMKDLALGVARITKLLRAIGCVVRTSNLKATKNEDGTTKAANPVVTAVLTLSIIKAKSKEGLQDEAPETPAKKTPAKKNTKKDEALASNITNDIATTPIKKPVAKNATPSKKTRKDKELLKKNISNDIGVKKEKRVKEESMEIE